MLNKDDVDIMRNLVREVTTEIVDDRLTKSENLFLQEMGRVQQVVNSDIEKIQKNLEE